MENIKVMMEVTGVMVMEVVVEGNREVMVSFFWTVCCVTVFVFF